MRRRTRMRRIVKDGRVVVDHMVEMPRPTPPIVYVECDLPEGMTLDAWRRAKARPPKPSPARRARRATGRVARRLRPRG